MTTTLESAKQGDPQALAALINKTLQPQGFNARVVKQGQCLRVLVQGDQPPDQVKVVSFIANGVKKLGVVGVNELEVLGQQTGTNRPTWRQKIAFEVKSPIAPVVPSEGASSAETASEEPEGSTTSEKQDKEKTVVKEPSDADAVVGCLGLIFIPTLIMGLLWSCIAGGNDTVRCQEKGLALVAAVNDRRPTSAESAEVARMCIDDSGAFGNLD